MLRLLGLVIGCGLIGADVPADDQTQRAPAPAFTMRDTYGQPVSIKGYKGSVAWITFGATW